MDTRTFLLALLSAYCLLPTAYSRAADWSRWRGPEQNGVSREKNLPEKWSAEGDNLLWSAEAGGMSSPIVMNGRVYTLTRIGEVQQPGTLVAGPQTQEAVVCLDANTGKKVWSYAMNMTQTEVPFHRLGWSNPCGDPATGNVYVFGAQCNLVCFDGNDGKVLWQRQMTEEFGMISTFGGRTPSPAVDEDQVFICGVAFGWGDNARSQYRVFALEKKTGQLNWTSGTGGLPVDAPYQTPVITVINGVKQLVVGSGDGGVYGFQPRTGKKLWGYQLSKRGLNASVIVDGSRVYACSGEVNFDNSGSGSIQCIDVGSGEPKLLWRKDGVEAGFSSPTLFDGRLYVCDQSATLWALDAMTGKEYWKKRCGTIGKASVVYADGKLYLPEANGRMWILKPEDKGCKVLSKVELEEKLGREYVIFGSVAIANGRIYFQAANTMYCIGPKEPRSSADPIPTLPQESAEGDRTPTQALVLPADVVLKPGEKQQFTVKLFDAMGRLAVFPKSRIAFSEWSVGQLTLPPPPKPPTTLPGMTATPSTAPAGPTKIGNLKGSVSSDGTFTAENAGHQGGAVVAKVNEVIGFARVRVLPPLPWKIDFEQSPLESPPLTWLGAGGKFAVKEIDGTKALCKVPLVDLYYRARTNFGTPDMANYTLQADVRSGFKDMGGQVQIPDPGIINQRYVMMLYGNHQRLQIHVWAGALPTDMSGSASLNRTIPFKWEPNKWYTMKLRVDQLADKAVARGKVWPRGEAEPEQWTIELEDPLPNRSGNPGLFGHSLVTPYKSEIYYDNILVTDNK